MARLPDGLLQVRYTEEQRNYDRREHLEQVGVEAEKNNRLVHEIIDNGSDCNPRKPHGKIRGDMPHDRLADNDSGKPDDHGAATHIDIGIPLILAEQSSGQRDQTVGQRQTDNLIDAGIDTLRPAHSRIATGRPDAATQFGAEKQVQYADNCRRCNPQQEQRRRNVHLGKQHRIRPRRNA